MSSKMSNKFTVNEDEELVENVCLYPILYDHQDIEFRNIVKKAKYWEKVVSAMTTERSVDECKKRWRDLRDNFFRILRRGQLPTGSAAPSTSKKWPLFERLTFLSKVSRENSSICTVTSPDCENEAPSQNAFCEESVADKEGEIPSTDCKLPFPAPKKKTNKRKAFDILQEKADKRMTLLQEIVSRKEEDEIDLFMRSLALKMKKLPSHKIHQAKIDMLNILEKHSQEFNCDNNSTSDHDYFNNILEIRPIEDDNEVFIM